MDGASMTSAQRGAANDEYRLVAMHALAADDIHCLLSDGGSFLGAEESILRIDKHTDETVKAGDQASYLRRKG